MLGFSNTKMEEYSNRGADASGGIIDDDDDDDDDDETSVEDNGSTNQWIKMFLIRQCIS